MIAEKRVESEFLNLSKKEKETWSLLNAQMKFGRGNEPLKSFARTTRGVQLVSLKVLTNFQATPLVGNKGIIDAFV